MNKVSERCAKDGCAKFLFASNRMYAEVKYSKLLLYALNIVPVVICFLPATDEIVKLICSCVSFLLTIINELASAFLSNHKEKAILLHQLYEAEITGSSFSKIEYDRESTNDLNELAIRKGLPKMHKLDKYPVSYVPDKITDDYSYLYLCRISAAKIRYLVSRLFYGYFFFLVLIGIALVCGTFLQQAGQMIYMIICFWPLIIPLIRNLTSCRKCAKQCVKICADIDNFFADGDDSVERLARFYYYVQNIEFEMLLVKPVIYNFVSAIFKKGVNDLTDGVTQRFIDATVELVGRSMIIKGIISQPRAKELITKTDYDLETLMRIKKMKSKSARSEAKTETAAAVVPVKPVAKPVAVKPKEQPKVIQVKPAGVKPVAAKPVAKPATKPAAKSGAVSQKPKTVAAKPAVTKKSDNKTSTVKKK